MSPSTPTPCTNGTGAGMLREPKPPRRIVLCFDGTGNKFSGDSSDTNIVDLYQMFDRSEKSQYHYYQPGIGTYSAGEGSLNVRLFGSIKRWVSQKVDQGVGTTFDHHVIAGYKFVMQYYKPGAKIYIFGFSRGAFTARFLARMITAIGLLSKGNQEMVSFAYRTYQDYETGNKTSPESLEYMNSFNRTFCQPLVDVHFLGLFDTVNSVGVFRGKQYPPALTPAMGTPGEPVVEDDKFGAVRHIRHAVSIDERRIKFRPALFNPDDSKDLKEVWFSGGHGDVGGGWPNTAESIAMNDKKKEARRSFIPSFVTNLVAKKSECPEAANLLANKSVCPEDTKDHDVQLSDLSLEWMIHELQSLPDADKEKLKFNSRVGTFLERIENKRDTAIKAKLLSIFKISFWKNPRYGTPRVLPATAVIHHSVHRRVIHYEEQAKEADPAANGRGWLSYFRLRRNPSMPPHPSGLGCAHYKPDNRNFASAHEREQARAERVVQTRSENWQCELAQGCTMKLPCKLPQAKDARP
ncbi:hypothetical protein BZA05DRAFT_441984 [Tricharina praecox]|uniref:uncharacterized protein n=1 Tax=Tricharina praecox TaxID=43433 RepID=UPI00221ED1DF|nr:uncharacterized protein BZA05DRAFT_441984 [Tricharina praecox]KAI5856305.1 hypothetical protein BZA05DRAFT_441984 [Tricharina praecox]